ncbi:uncharacterized protein [Branchiostoma lanceolatum]|uniref:uncharacterized protein n=1 Tax=Branchiostoma lanceolatum TaxID=7740 RepID=UPI003451712D
MLPTSLTNVILFLVCFPTSFALLRARTSSEPEVGHFAVEENGKKCLLLDIAATFHIQYEKNDNTTGKVSYALPIDSTTAAGTCAWTFGKKAGISLGFFTGYHDFGVRMEFKRSLNLLHPTFWLSTLAVRYTLDPSLFPGAKYVNQTMLPELIMLREFETKTSKSYLCTTDQTFSLGFPLTPLVELVANYIKVQPFDVHKQEFSAADECPQDHLLTTFPMATTTAAPATTPIHDIPVGHFRLRNERGEICLLLNWGVRFHVEYQTQKGFGYAQYVLPPDARAVGSCKENFATISLGFADGFDLTVDFQTDGKTFDVFTFSITYVTSLPHFPNAKHPNKPVTELSHLVRPFRDDVGKSYLCKTKQTLRIILLTLDIVDWQVQPFGVKNGRFSDPMECYQDNPTTVFPVIANATTILPANVTVGPASTVLPTNHTTVSPANHTHTVGPSTNQTTPSPTNHTQTPVPPSTTNHVPAPAASYGLEIGLGVGLGLAAILVGLGIFWFIRRRAAKRYIPLDSILEPDLPE